MPNTSLHPNPAHRVCLASQPLPSTSTTPRPLVTSFEKPRTLTKQLQTEFVSKLGNGGLSSFCYCLTGVERVDTGRGSLCPSVLGMLTKPRPAGPRVSFFAKQSLARLLDASTGEGQSNSAVQIGKIFQCSAVAGRDL